MDLPIVVSHKTCWLLQHAPGYLERRITQNTNRTVPENYDADAPLISADDLAANHIALPPCATAPVNQTAAPANQAIAPTGRAATSTDRATAIMPREICRYLYAVLKTLGVNTNDFTKPDVLVAFAHDRVRSRSFICHARKALITSDDIIAIAPGILAVNEAACFVQAATWMSELELVEYGFELCGAYATLAHGGYEEHDPFCTREELMAYLDRHPGMRGAKRARQALSMIRNGSRSPMESATAMMISCSRRLGGLGFRSFSMNHRITTPDRLKTMTNISYVEIDIFSERHRAGVEYDGSEHGKDARRAHDADRLSMLGRMGIHVIVLTNIHFANQLKLHRALNAIAKLFGCAQDESAEF